MIRRSLILGCAAILNGLGAAGAQAWTAQLVLSPLPSPFVSDWEVDPSVAELIVTNGTAAATAVTFHYTLARGSQVVLRGVTDAHTVGGNESKVFNASTTFGGKADWNRELQDMVARTGRLPEGEYQGCVALAGPGGVVLIERECATFTVGYPDPPFLVYPMNGDTVRSQAPMFEWQPVQLPAMADARIGYVLQVAEVNPTMRQSPEIALSSNILHYVEPGLIETAHQYPVGALPLVSGRTYAWRVQALDGTGKPIASNQGRSEIWTFVYREPESEAQRTVARVELTASRDTLRFAGDTVRYVVQAYDVDNVEITGKVAVWRSTDTTVVDVDSIGVVRGAGVGQAHIVATVDGVVDSAASVMAMRTGLAIRFQTYDAEQAAPSLLDVIESTPVTEIGPKLMAMLQAGELVIPIPRLPGMPAGSSGDDERSGMRDAREDFAARDGGGPWLSNADDGARSRRDACADTAFNVRDPYLSLTEKVFVFYVPLNREQRQEVTRCLGVANPSTGDVDEAERLRGAMFVVSWKHPGVPRAFLAVKGPGLGLTIAGPTVHVRYLVINLLQPLTVGADLLPDNFDGFFGDVSFDAGRGATFYSVRRCVDAVTPLCKVLTWINPESPDITIQAFAGVTAGETSAQVGTGGLQTGLKGGKSKALGFSIEASLPVAYPRWGPDSLQLGIMVAAQDSMVGEVDLRQRDSVAASHNWSLGVALTPTVWWTSYWPDGTKRNEWELSGSIGLEVDPSQPSNAPKAIISLQVPAIWKLGIVRLGNPQLVVSKPLEGGGEVEVGLSGTWGFGPADGVGLDPEAGGGSVSTDAGGSATGGVAGFEEFGRATVIIKLAPLPPAQARDSAISTVTSSLHVVREKEARVQAAKAAADDAKASRDRYYTTVERAEGSPPSVLDDPIAKGLTEALVDADDDLKAAQDDLQRAQRKLDLERVDRDKAIQAVKDEEAKGGEKPKPLQCTTVVGGKCLTWTLKGSVKDGSFSDLIVAALRFLTGTL